MTRTNGPDLTPAVQAVTRLMDDDCVVVRPGQPTGGVDPANGRPLVSAPGQVYGGPCLVASGNPTDVPSERGGGVSIINETFISIPLSAPNVPQVGDIYVITGSRRDPAMVPGGIGRAYKVIVVPYKTFAISRKVRVESQPESVLALTGLQPVTPIVQPGTGGDVGVELFQFAAASVWTFTVPPSFAGRRPAVEVYVDGEEWMADVVSTSTTVTVTFGTPQVGSVVLT